LYLTEYKIHGNLGTILRTVDSAGLSQLVISKTSVDAYNPKVVRSTMGAIFRVNVIECDNITKIIKEIKSENPSLFSLQKEDWFEKRNYFLEENKKLLKLLIKKGNQKISFNLDQKELFMMQKLYLLYPDTLPKKLLSLPWENIKIILSLCELEKRKFYTDISYYLELDKEKLENYIIKDLYEKVIFLISEIQDYNIINEENFLNKVIKIEEMIYEK